uniref:Ubiquitin-like domain-containing protein n=1 Tax=Rhizophora mucronata TaxID=61149 RepID=A0A2P2K3A2_RHIMU
MEPMKPKIKEGMFVKRGSFSGRKDIKVEDLEVRPGGMIVQRRSTSESNQISVAIPTIKVRVKFGSFYREIRISSQASFGELKKMLAEQTGVHHQDQKLIYKKKERNSKAFLDVAGVKDGSKIVLIEDITSRERRCLEMLKSARTEKASKSLQQISLEVDKLDGDVKALEATSSRGMKVAETDVDKLTELLMTKLVTLDGIDINGELKLQKRMQVLLKVELVN